jgi:hypothetical protein
MRDSIPETAKRADRAEQALRQIAAPRWTQTAADMTHGHDAKLKRGRR